MSILMRNDNAEFVMQAYRELVTAKKKSLISQRVRVLAEQHGQFVRLLKKSYAEYEAVFSRESGYLLGESVKQYFGQIQNLIFCEALPNTADVLLVIVRGGNVYLDTKISAKNIRSELVPLLTEQQAYQVIVSGLVPLKQKPTKDEFSLPSELVHSFEMLDAPLFPRLPLMRHLQLLSLPLALKAEHLNGQPTTRVFILLVAMVIVGIAAHWFFSAKKMLLIHSTLITPINIYQAYDQALMTPSPRLQLFELSNLVQMLYSLPGWQAVKISYTQRQYQITVTSLGGDFEALHTWANQQQFDFTLTPHAALLITASSLSGRTRPKNIYSAQLVLTTLMDQLEDVLNNKKISLAQSISHGRVIEIPFTIQLTDTLPQALILMGETFHDLPISINHMELSLKPGMISGNINLSTWGK